MSRSNAIEDAQRAIREAEARIAEGQRARDAAQTALEEALAAIGWRRMAGAFSPGATPLFVNDLYPDAALDVAKVVRVLEQQRRALA